MSYYIGVNFKELNENETVFDVFDKLKEIHLNKKEEILKENMIFIPSIYRFDIWEPKYQDWYKDTTSFENIYSSAINAIQLVDDKWLNNLFSLKIFYWKEYNLIGVTSPLTRLDGFKYIDFQDSADQDYELEYWKGIHMFEEVVEQEKTLTIDMLKKDTYYEDGDDKDYYHRTWIYNTIWKKLDLDAWCYRDGKSDVVKITKINLIDDIYKEAQLSILMKQLRKNFLQEKIDKKEI